jgi:hypothetical protein
MNLLFPNNINKIRIDVGTGATAPNTAIWLRDNKDTAVLCFEADPRSYDILINGGYTNQYISKLRFTKKKYLLLNNKIVKKIDTKIVKIFNVAISNVQKKKIDFFLSDEKNFGTSSLLVPIENRLKQKIKKKIKIPVFKLKYFLSKIDWNKFKYIEFLKIDTQGNDINVLKSCGKYLRKFCFIQAEYWANQSYVGEKDRVHCLALIQKFMKKEGFELYYYTLVDAYFVNTNLKNNIFFDKVIDNTMDFEDGLYRKSFFLNFFPKKLIFYANLIFFFRNFKIFNYFFYKVLKINFKKFI